MLLIAACAAPRDSPGPTALAMAETLYYHGEIDSARTLWRSQLERARETRDSAAIARTVTWLGIAAWKQGDLVEARRLGEQSLELKLRLGLTADLAKSYNALGLVAWHQARLAEADLLFGNATVRARAAGDTKAVAAAAANLGLIRVEQGRFVADRDDLEVAGRLAREAGEGRLEGNALTNLAMLDIRTGDPEAAIQELKRARAAYRQIGLTAQEQNALGQLGTAYDALGEPRLAIAALDSALVQARAQGLRQEEASDLEALARQYRKAGELHRALDSYAQAKVIDGELELETELGADLREEAEIYAALGDLELSRRHAADALSRHRRIDAPYEVFLDHLLLAELATRAHRDAEADAELAAAQGLAVRLGVRTVRLDAALAEARLADARGDARRVLRVLARGGADLARGDYDSEWETAALRSRAYTRLGRFEQAAVDGRAAVAAIERVRGRFGSGALRTAYLADRASAYADLVGVLLRLEQWDDAFATADAARGRALLDYLAVSRPGSAGLDPIAQRLQYGEGLLLRIDGLVRKIDESERDLAVEADPAESASVRSVYDQLGQARRDYEAFLVTQAERADELGPLLGATVMAPARVRGSLRPDEALVEYLVTPDRVRLFVLTQAGVVTLEAPVAAQNLVSRVRLARDLIGRPAGAAGSPGPPVLGALFETLVRPMLRSGVLRGVRRLLVVPHSVLTYLPFSALRDDSTGRYLIEDYALAYLPSAAALPALRERPRPNPVGSGSVVFAPLPEELPATRVEAAAVRAGLQGATLRIGRTATERRFREALGKGGIVHVASHGRLDATNPLFSAIDFSQGSDSPDDDGRFELHELLGLTVTSPLVFLSGCETGLGLAGSTDFARGEDYATLAQAFLYAGARDVVATLWQVEDEGAAAFAAHFYGHLGATDPVMALADAQRDLLLHSRYSSPYYWAPYVIAGDGQMPATPKSLHQVSVR
jgi:tetratricopeptide (TPR) repeat protein